MSTREKCWASCPSHPSAPTPPGKAALIRSSKGQGWEASGWLLRLSGGTIGLKPQNWGQVSVPPLTWLITE